MTKEIPVVYNPNHQIHQPQHEIFNGEKKPHLDKSVRINMILEALEQSGCVDIQITQADTVFPFISRAHDSAYLEYLKTTSDYARKVSLKKDNPNFAIYPTIHPYSQYSQAHSNISRRGRYVFDTYTPIMKDTYQAAIESAGVAVVGATLIQSGESLVYSLNRPSGHHAQKDIVGGMNYINNTAVAVEYFLSQGNKKVAILDIDLHHGNGTQDIYYNNPNVFVVSIHADPRFCYPHFTGYQEELGEGEGFETNRNFPLPQDTNDHLYDDILQKALTIIRKFQPEKLLISAGFDTHKDDPVSKFKLTTAYYKTLGNRIKRLDIPTLIIQEGGYVSNSLGLNVITFLKGLM